jgi:hypothetical protein
MVDQNPGFMHQAIWGLTHPDDVHPGVADIVANSALLDLFLIRQFKAHGGIVLPPLQSAKALQDAHEIVAAQEIAQGKVWSAGPNGRSMVRYPNW